jgi:hypothetical protein
MNSSPNKSNAASQDLDTAGMPNEAVRTIVTLVLFFHLFIAVVAALGVLRVSSGSELVGRLNQKLVDQLEYPEELLLSRFGYHPTYNRDIDYDGSAEIVLNWEAADEAEPSRIDAKEKLVLFDPAEIKLPIRRQRYLSLIRRMTDVATSEPPSPQEVDLPIAVSRVLLADAGNPEGRHRFRLLRIPTPAPSYADERIPPTLPPAYQGNVVLRGENLEFIKADRAAASSPVVPGRAAGTPANAPLTPGQDGLLNPGANSPGGVLPIVPQTLLPPTDNPANPARTDGNR